MRVLPIPKSLEDDQHEQVADSHEKQKTYMHKVADNCWGSERWCSDAEDETQTIGGQCTRLKYDMIERH